MSPPQLNPQILILVRKLFADKYGLSVRQMEDFFQGEMQEEKPIEYGNNKRDYFQNLLQSFELSKQVKLLLRLCNDPPEIEMSHGYPPQDECKKLVKLINEFVASLESEGVKGAIERIIFAHNGRLLRIQFPDALSWSQPNVARNDENYLLYQQPLMEDGLKWQELLDWWKGYTNDFSATRQQLNDKLYGRLYQSLSESSPPERLFFENYFTYYRNKLECALPALIPQVLIQYETFTKNYREKLGIKDGFELQRVDFMLLLSPRKRIIIEIDGSQHYSDNDKPNPQKYAAMVREDRNLKLNGYEVYRFGGAEITETTARTIVEDFFNKLFDKHKVHLI